HCGRLTRRDDLNRMRSEEFFGEHVSNHSAIQIVRDRQSSRIHNRRHKVTHGWYSIERHRGNPRPFAHYNALRPVITAPPEPALPNLFGWIAKMSSRIPVNVEVAAALSKRS